MVRKTFAIILSTIVSERMESDGSVSSCFPLRGSEYVVCLSWESDDGVAVEVEDKTTSDQWRATFDASCKSI